MLRGLVLAASVWATADAGLTAAYADDIRTAAITIETGSLGAPANAGVSGAEALSAKRPLTDEAHPAAKTRSWILRQILGLKSAMGRQTQPIETAALAPGPRRDAAPHPPRLLIADADPNFGKWQAHANEKLKSENSTANPKDHPVAAQYPDDFVVVCEAGCREPTGQIVYMVSKAKAATGVKGTLQTSAWDEPAAVQTPSVETKFSGDPTSLPCVAGCYDRPEPRRSAEVKKAGITAPAATAHLEVTSVKGEAAAAPAGPGDSNAAPAAVRIKDRIKKAVAIAKGPKSSLRTVLKSGKSWQAKVVRSKSASGHTARPSRKPLEHYERLSTVRLRHQSFSRTIENALR